MKEKIRVADDRDVVKAIRRGSREAEISLYGHPLCHKRIFKNKKKYTRKQKYVNPELI